MQNEIDDEPLREFHSRACAAETPVELNQALVQKLISRSLGPSLGGQCSKPDA